MRLAVCPVRKEHHTGDYSLLQMELESELKS